MKHIRPMRTALVAVAACVLLASAGVATAAVPPTLTHQGRLYDAAGNPITGTQAVTFSIYSGPNDPVPVWSETPDVTFDDGYFSVALGDVVDLIAVLDGQTKYLGVTVGNDAEMTPR